jgi:hypothetical protein
METFFQKLAERVNSENNLSDMTWALCSSNNAFQKIFLDYCFDKTIKNDIDYIKREQKKDNTRPDFLIYVNENEKYLLEVKIYDKNPHDNYGKVFKDMPRAFIANYKLSEKNTIYNFKKTWHGFIKYIEKQIENVNGINNSIVKGYLTYLKAVTNYFKGEPMNLNNLHSLSILLKTIKKIIKETFDDVEPKYDGGDEWAGYRFKFYKEKKRFNIWFGITFGKEEIYLFIEFLDDCSELVYEKLKKSSSGIYFEKPEKNEEDGRIYVIIKSKYLKILCNTKKSSEYQYDLLKKYFDDVMHLFLINLSPTARLKK